MYELIKGEGAHHGNSYNAVAAVTMPVAVERHPQSPQGFLKKGAPAERWRRG